MTLRRDHKQRDDRATKCQWVRCRKDAEIIYLRDGLCTEHWLALATQQERAEMVPIRIVEVAS